MDEEERKQQEMEKKNLLFHCNIAREFIGDAIIFNLEHVTESIRNQKFQIVNQIGIILNTCPQLAKIGFLYKSFLATNLIVSLFVKTIPAASR